MFQDDNAGLSFQIGTEMFIGVKEDVVTNY